MKYIMFERTDGGLTRRWPVIIPNGLTHSEMAEALLKTEELQGAKVLSAGECNVGFVSCHGKSSTLGVGSLEREDDEIINGNDYWHGIVNGI